MPVEWQAPAVVLSARPYGEGAALVTLFTEAYGRHAGLAKGGASRRQAGIWQPGNLVEARWLARLPDQLGALSGELVHATAALAMEDALALALLSSATALAEAALPEREAHPALFRGLVSILARLAQGAEEVFADLIRWEALLLAELGYGLDLSACAATGAREDLTHVSPRSGRAVSMQAAVPYLDRLLVLPPFLLHPEEAGEPQDWLAGLRLTGHFLEKRLFAATHRPLPEARVRLQERLAQMVEGGG
jgi:DNA repair protein RecO (recombination protein O)